MGVTILSSSALHLSTNMKFLVLAACVALSSSQAFYGNGYGLGLGYSGYGYAGYGAGLGYTGYRAGLGYDAGYTGYGYSGYDSGYPGYGTGYGYSAAPLVSSASGIGYTGYAPNYAAGYGYSSPLNLNTQLIAHPNGAVVPLDEPAVAAARADHLASKGAAYAASAPVIAAVPAISAAPIAVPAPYSSLNYGYSGPLNLNTQLVAHPNGAVVPVDEPAVAAARADHLATKGVYGGVYAAT